MSWEEEIEVFQINRRRVNRMIIVYTRLEAKSQNR
jgi:hypothetical protein